MKKYLLLLLCLCACFSQQAQSVQYNVGLAYDTATITYHNDQRLMLNGKLLQKRQLKQLLLSDPQSAIFYKKYRRAKNISNGLIIGVGAAYVSGLFLAPFAPEVSLVLFGSGLIGSFAALPSSFKARRHLHHSVWLYNRARILKAVELTGG